MTIEILFGEVCSLYGDGQNAAYLRATVPDARFIFTPLTARPYFADSQPDLIYIGAMSERTQRRVIDVLTPFQKRLTQLVDAGVPILATGNAGEIFTQRIDYVTEEIQKDGLGLFDMTVKTDLFDRYNGKVLAQCGDITLVGFRSQFSFLYGDNSGCYFAKCLRGDGVNRESKLEGLRRKNLICTQILGPILPLNPLFCEYLLGLAGVTAKAAYRDAAMDAYRQRLQEFQDPKVVFGHNK